MLFLKTIEHYINGLHAENKSPRTIEVYQSILSMLAKQIGNIKLADISALQIRNFLYTRSQGNSPATVHQSFRVLRTFFRWCLAEGILEQYPMHNIKPPHLSKKVIVTFTATEIKAMMATCRQKTFIGERNRAIILCLLDSGLRSAELRDLTINDVDYRQGVIKVKGKGDKERIVHIGANARQQLWRYMLVRDSKDKRGLQGLFLSDRMKPFTRTGFNTVIHKICLAAGLKGEKRSPHTFRHTFAIQYLRNGGNLATLQLTLGHSNIATTMVYLTALDSDDVIKAHQQFSPADRML